MENLVVRSEHNPVLLKGPTSVLIASGVVLCAGVVGALQPLATAWMTLTGRYLWTGGGADPRKPLVQLPQLLQADIREGQSMLLEDLPAWLRVLCATPSVVYAVALVVGSVLLARVLRVIARGDAFGALARRHLTRLSLVLTGGGVLAGTLDTAAVGAIMRMASRDDHRESIFFPVEALGIDVPSWPAMLIVIGLVAAALTLAFREGARMREELIGVV